MSAHVPVECSGCERGCWFCDSGLFACDVCDSFEGATTTDCPGRRMTRQEIDKVYAGEINFRAGEWRAEASGSCSSHLERREDGVYLNGERLS